MIGQTEDSGWLPEAGVLQPRPWTEEGWGSAREVGVQERAGAGHVECFLFLWKMAPGPVSLVSR